MGNDINGLPVNATSIKKRRIDGTFEDNPSNDGQSNPSLSIERDDLKMGKNRNTGPYSSQSESMEGQNK